MIKNLQILNLNQKTFLFPERGSVFSLNKTQFLVPEWICETVEFLTSLISLFQCWRIAPSSDFTKVKMASCSTTSGAATMDFIGAESTLKSLRPETFGFTSPWLVSWTRWIINERNILSFLSTKMLGIF